MEEPERKDTSSDVEADDGVAGATSALPPGLRDSNRRPSTRQITGVSGLIGRPELDAVVQGTAKSSTRASMKNVRTGVSALELTKVQGVWDMVERVRADHAKSVAPMLAGLGPFLKNIHDVTSSTTFVESLAGTQGVWDMVERVRADHAKSVAPMLAGLGPFLKNIHDVTSSTTFVESLAGTQGVWDMVERVRADHAKSVAPMLAGLGPVLKNIHGLNVRASQTSALQSSLRQIAGSISSVFTDDLFNEFEALRDQFREWLPDNLREIEGRPLLRISEEDGTCLAWAPRAEIVAELLELRSSEDRQRCLVEHRLEVVEDVEVSLEEVDHPELLELRDLTLQSAACIRDGHDAPAQAMLGNILETLMLAHGKSWMRSYFPQAQMPENPNAGNHKVITAAYNFCSGVAQLRMLGPYLFINAMKNVFSGDGDFQETFNRHLGVHKVSGNSYRSEFAFAALLNTQALLRLVDRYLYV